MYYCIKNEMGVMPFDESTASFMVESDNYDVIKQHGRNTGLDSVAEFIVDDQGVVIKAIPELLESFLIKFEESTGIRPTQLLFS